MFATELQSTLPIRNNTCQLQSIFVLPINLRYSADFANQHSFISPYAHQPKPARQVLDIAAATEAPAPYSASSESGALNSRSNNSSNIQNNCIIAICFSAQR